MILARQVCVIGSVMDAEALKLVASEAIDSRAAELTGLGVQIWENPELNYEEYKAHDLLTGFLEENGFSVICSYTNIETAFRATFGEGTPSIAIICEYDALPELGHACGHNLIAEAGVAAVLAVKAALQALPTGSNGRVTVLGTPAEEGGGGKILLMKSGAFEDVDLVMMVHPAPCTVIRPVFNAVKEFHVTYRGKASHAAAYPWEGVNSLDAAVVAYNAIGLLRQQMKPAWRCHLVIVKGGVKPNVIPDISMLDVYIKAPNVDELCTLESRVRGCFESAATSTGCKVVIKQMNYVHSDIQHNAVLAEKFAENYRQLGATFADEAEMYGSTDMIRISRVVPTLYPYFGIGSGREVNHSVEFVGVSNSPESHSKALQAAKAMAHTCIDVLTTGGLMAKIKQNFCEQTKPP